MVKAEEEKEEIQDNKSEINTVNQWKIKERKKERILSICM